MCTHNYFNINRFDEVIAKIRRYSFLLYCVMGCANGTYYVNALTLEPPRGVNLPFLIFDL